MSRREEEQFRWWALRLSFTALVLALGFAIGVASRADAQATWSTTIEWRSSVVRVVSACGPQDPAAVVAELEAGRARAVADLGTEALPALGTVADPYIILATADPRCPGGALACSTDAPLSRSTWTLVKTRCGNKVLAAIDHEAMHRWCALVRASVVPPRTVAELRAGVKGPCLLADHKGGKGMRYDVAGRAVPAPAKPKKPKRVKL